jgi:hypothetical protein
MADETLKPKTVRGAPSVRLQRAIDQVEREYSSDTIARLRRSIRGQAIIARLMGHIIGTVELSTSQVHAAQVLLRKIIPDLNSVEVSAQPDDRPSVVRAPLPIRTAEEWERHVAASQPSRDDLTLSGRGMREMTIPEVGIKSRKVISNSDIAWNLRVRAGHWL